MFSLNLKIFITFILIKNNFNTSTNKSKLIKKVEKTQNNRGIINLKNHRNKMKKLKKLYIFHYIKKKSLSRTSIKLTTNQLISLIITIIIRINLFINITIKIKFIVLIKFSFISFNFKETHFDYIFHFYNDFINLINYLKYILSSQY